MKIQSVYANPALTYFLTLYLYGPDTPNFATFEMRLFARQKWYFLLHKPEKLLVVQIGH